MLIMKKDDYLHLRLGNVLGREEEGGGAVQTHLVTPGKDEGVLQHHLAIRERRRRQSTPPPGEYSREERKRSSSRTEKEITPDSPKVRVKGI